MELALKAALTASLITVLILAADRFGEWIAGLVSGLPLTAAPALLLIGHERGLAAAADAAVGGIVGCALASMFALAYHGAARRLAPAPALVLAIACMAIGLAVLGRLSLSLAAAGAVTSACAVAALLFIRNPAADQRTLTRSRPRDPWPALVVGLISAAVSTVVIEMNASLAGVVAAMPMIGVATVASCHASRGRAAVPRYLRAYVISSLAKAAFCAAFAASVISQGSAVALLYACLIGGLVGALALTLGPLRKALRRLVRMARDWKRPENLVTCASVHDRLPVARRANAVKIPSRLLALVALWLCASMPAIGAEPAVGSPGRYLDVHGVKLYVETFGSGGVPIVFLHGGIHHFDNSFARQRDVFSPTREVVGIDQRGHGHSFDDARPFSYAAMADDTADVILQLGLGPVDVVGHSDGGDVALKLARAHPELVRRVVVSGANLRPGLPPDEVQRRLAWSPQQLADFLPRFAAQIPPSFRTDYEAVTPEAAGHWDAFLAKSYRLWLTPVVIDAADLKGIAAPVLVIAGDQDFSSVEETAEIFRGLSKAELMIVPGSGHGTFDDRTTLMNLAIREFLDKP